MNLSPSVASNESYELYLDGLRGIAILMVMGFHTSLSVKGTPYFPNFNIYIEHLSRGVHLFFILSAFTLFKSSLNRISVDGFSKKSFYIRRAFRILPLWWIAVFLYTMFWTSEQSSFRIISVTLLIFGIFKDAWTICFIPVGWSLFVEETFYLLFPLYIKYIKKIGTALLFLFCSLLLAKLWYREYYHFGVSSVFSAIFPLGNYFAFFLGIFLFFLVNRSTMKDLYEHSCFRIILDLLTFSGFIGIFFYDRIMGTIFLAPLIVSSFSHLTIFGKISRNKLLARFGGYCYSIYLFHGPVTGYLNPFQASFFKNLGIQEFPQEIKVFAWFFPVAFFSLITGFFFFNLIELPFVNLGKKIISKYNL